MFFNPKQTRHPERSAAQICRITSALWRAVEEPVPSVAEGTPAVLRLRMLLKAFRPPKPENSILLVYSLDGHGYISSCTVIIFQPQVWRCLFPAPRKDSGGSARIGLRWSKSFEQHAQPKDRRGSLGYARDRLFDCAPQGTRYATDLRGASLRMTGLLEVEKQPVRRAENTKDRRSHRLSATLWRGSGTTGLEPATPAVAHSDEKDPFVRSLERARGREPWLGFGLGNPLFPSWLRLSLLFYEDGQIF